MHKTDYYLICKGKGCDTFLTEAGTWSKNILKAINFDNLKMAQDHLQSSRLRTGRIVFHETVGTITENRYETETFLREIPKDVRL